MGSATSTNACGILFASKLSKSFSHPVTLAIIFLADAQLRSFGIFLGSAIKTITAAVTLSTPSGGLPMDFSSVRELLSKASKAARAASTMGLAAARSAAHSLAKASTSTTILFVFASSTAAISLCSCTTTFSLPTNSNSSAVALDFSSTTTCSLVSTSFNPATCSDASLIFKIPVTRRSVLSTKNVLFTPNICLYKEMSSKNDLGVV
mmetsp:Transcript_65533/g.109112  ORF Transcript_65533/g.109112 Transcript_65533/m.109112 type:complete len:207 (+) Transcript_65533:4267-4887(+)